MSKPINIDKMTPEELFSLNQRIVTRLKEIDQEKKTEFAVGNYVKLQGDGETINGVLVKLTKKRLHVLTGQGVLSTPPIRATKLTRKPAKLDKEIKAFVEARAAFDRDAAQFAELLKKHGTIEISPNGTIKGWE